MPKRFTQESNLYSKAETGNGFDLMQAYQGGLVPKEFLGLGYESGGNSTFSNVAHNLQQAKRLENIASNTVADEVTFAVNLKDKKSINRLK